MCGILCSSRLDLVSEVVYFLLFRGIVASIIVSLISLVGVALLPLGTKRWNNYLLSPLVSFAVGSLVGDVFLHLVPSMNYQLHSPKIFSELTHTLTMKKKIHWEKEDIYCTCHSSSSPF